MYAFMYKTKNIADFFVLYLEPLELLPACKDYSFHSSKNKASMIL